MASLPRSWNRLLGLNTYRSEEPSFYRYRRYRYRRILPFFRRSHHQYLGLLLACLFIESTHSASRYSIALIRTYSTSFNIMAESQR